MAEPSATKPSISVHGFLSKAAESMGLSVLAGAASMETEFLDSPRVQKLGLALSGFTHRIHRGRIQIFGNSERYFFSGLDGEGISAAIERLDFQNISCILVTAGNQAPVTLVEFASKRGIPLLATALASSESISTIGEILGYELAPSMTIHGVLMEIFGVGVLLRGESGIGKSECALDLIGKGHRLVADDAVNIRRIAERIIGEAPEIIRDHLEIRGLGIINARELLGVSALAEKAEIQLCLDFVGETESSESDRLRIDGETANLLGVNVAKFVLPVRPGRNLATLAETAVRVFASKRSAKHFAAGLIERYDRSLGSAK